MNACHVRAMLHQTFQRKAVIIVPECSWTGSECDLLVVHDSLRIIDVEIKVSRADFKRDAAKDKWWRRVSWSMGPPQHLEWPRRVWKHYFAMPADVWKPELTEFLPSAASGVILVRDRGSFMHAEVERRATPNKDAEPISPKACVDLARLAGLRMWDALATAQKSTSTPPQQPAAR